MQGEIEQNIRKFEKTQKTGNLKFYDFHLSSGKVTWCGFTQGEI